jgi:polysaccharide biosynthesis protein PslG
MTRARLSLILIVLAGVLALAAGSAVGAGAQRASSSSPLVGIGDEQPAMFANPAFKALHTRIARYVTPYDVASNHSHNDLPRLKAWLAAAKKQGIQPLIAFYHSDRTARKMPSVKTYTSEIKKFLKAFPQVRLLQPWNEANRGNVKESGNGSYSSPSATQSAQYYLALKAACPKCTIVGLDVLDSTDVPATIRYINVFKRYLGPKRLPSIWGLHNYSDTNRFHSTGTRAVLADTTGQLWLTETGGIVKLSGDFPFSLARQTKATKYMFSLTGLSRRITRLYVFQWTGGVTARERFDAGLTDVHGKPRPAYCVIYEHLLHKRSCSVKTAKD